MCHDLRSTALGCAKAGISILPIDHSSKRPAVELLPRDREGNPIWRPFQNAIADEETIQSWFDDSIESIAVVGGGVSGGLLVLDFDIARFYEAWCEQVSELADGLPVQRTGGGGFQVFVRCPQPGGNKQLAWTPADQEETGRTIAVETRGEGGYAVVAPSVHPSGSHYKMLRGSLTSIPTVSQARTDALLAAARKLDEAPRTRQQEERLAAEAHEAQRKQSRRASGQPDVIDVFNGRVPIVDMLAKHGYRQGPRGRYIRPGGKSESVSVRDGRSVHWSTNDPLNDGRVKAGCGCHDAFDIYAHFEHAGDVARAVKAAAALLKIDPPTSIRVNPRPEIVAGNRDEPYTPYLVHALPQVLRQYVEAVAEAMQTDPAAVALAVLTTCAAAIGTSRAIVLKRRWVEIPLLWSVVVAEQGSGKSPPMREAMRPLAERQRTEFERHRQAMEGYKNDLAEHQRDTKRFQAGKDAEAPQEPDPPACVRHVVSDTTLEALAPILLENPRGVLLDGDELSGWFGMMDRYAKTQHADAARWRRIFDGHPITIDRSTGRQSIHVPRPAVSILGTIQPAILERVLTSEHLESGLSARLLLASPPRSPVRWSDHDIPEAKETAYQAVVDGLLRLQPSVESDGHPEPVGVPLATGGRRRFIEWHDAHRTEQLDLWGVLSGHWSKLVSICARLALIVQMVRRVAGETSGDEIDAKSVDAAVTLIEWHKGEAKRVYAMLAEDEDSREQRRLVELIRNRGGRVTVREWQRARSLRTAEDAEAELNGLVDAELGSWSDPAPSPRGGRPSKRFVLAGPPAQLSAAAADADSQPGASQDARPPDNDDSEER